MWESELDAVAASDIEYRSLFWLPKLLQTAKEGESILDEMIGMIDEFYDDDINAGDDGFLSDNEELNMIPGHRRNQILGDLEEIEGVTTTVEVVPKVYTHLYTHIYTHTHLHKHTSVRICIISRPWPCPPQAYEP